MRVVRFRVAAEAAQVQAAVSTLRKTPPETQGHLERKSVELGIRQERMPMSVHRNRRPTNAIRGIGGNSLHRGESHDSPLLTFI